MNIGPNSSSKISRPIRSITDREFRALVAPENYVSLVDLLCPQRRCIVYAGKDIPLQFDTSHLTTEGSILVAQKLAQLPRFAALVEGRSLSSGNSGNADIKIAAGLLETRRVSRLWRCLANPEA